MGLISASTRVIAADNKLSSQVTDEVVVMDLDKAEYYGFNSVGAIVWNQLIKPVSVAELSQSVCREFAVDQEQALADVTQLLEDLLEKGLIKVLP